MTSSTVAQPTPAAVRLGVVLDPGQLAASPHNDALRHELREALDAAYPGLQWDVSLATGHESAPDDSSLDLLEALRDRKLDEDWDVAVGLTDQPLQQGSHTLPAQISSAHASGVISLSATGMSAVDAVPRVVARVLGLDPDDDPSPGELRAAVASATQLAEDLDGEADELAARFAWRVARANLQLLWSTVRANRPWMLAVKLTRSLSAALATGALTLITTDLWMLSAEYSGVQMAVLGVLSVIAVTVALIVGAKLWEHPRRRREREQVMIFNLAASATVLIGVVVLHVMLFLAALAGALLLVDPDVFEEVTGATATAVQYVKLAWLVGGLATIGSALGAGLEEDDDVRAAIFTRNQA